MCLGGLVGYSSDEDSEEDDVHNNNNGGSDDDFSSDDEVFLNDLALEAKREKFEKAQNERLNDLLDGWFLVRSISFVVFDF